ncbi:shikimate kinase [Arcanobacterium hippocoleae]
MTFPKAVFIGMPGVGKSAVGKRVARRLGVDFTDTDWLIEERAGKSIEDIFAQDGEAAFRQLEAEVIADALRNFTGVISLGGGAVTTEKTRKALRNQRVILIEAEDKVLAARLRNSPNIRPILADDVEAKLAGLRQTRLPLYRQLAHEVLISNQEPVFSVVDDALATIQSPPQKVTVSGEQQYTVYIGHHLKASIIAQAQNYPAAMVIYSPDVQEFAFEIAQSLQICDVQTSKFAVPAGEAAKMSTCLQKHGSTQGQIILAATDLLLLSAAEQLPISAGS